MGVPFRTGSLYPGSVELAEYAFLRDQDHRTVGALVDLLASTLER